MEILGKSCTACGIERKKKGAILYTHDTLKPFCQNPYICTGEHPNKPENILARGSILEMVEAEEAQKMFSERLKQKYTNSDVVKKVTRLLTQPSTVRINDVELAEFLVALQEKYSLATVSDAIRYCINECKDIHNGLDFKAKQLEQLQEQRAKEIENMQELAKEVEKERMEEVKEVKAEIESVQKEKEKLEEIRKEEKEQEVPAPVEEDDWVF